MQQSEFLSKLDQQRIVDAIGEAEKRTSGEIRVHIQPRSGGNIRDVAERTFERLGMTKTALRNGVLLFIASEENQFVILGDKAIDDNVPHGFWDAIAAKLTIHFKAGEFTEGIIDAISAAGEQLRTYFPYEESDVDELSNEIDIEE